MAFSLRKNQTELRIQTVFVSYYMAIWPLGNVLFNFKSLALQLLVTTLVYLEVTVTVLQIQF